jgi:hypothetical protein
MNLKANQQYCSSSYKKFKQLRKTTFYVGFLLKRRLVDDHVLVSVGFFKIKMLTANAPVATVLS